MLKNTITEKEENLITSTDDLKEIFLSGCKSCKEKNTGLEFEKLPINKKTFKAAPYAEVAKFLLNFKTQNNANWENISENNSILGLKNIDGTITLEPGSQTELSLAPKSNINDIKKYVDVYNKKTSEIADKFGIYWLGYGIQPVSTYRYINIIPKKRYELMTKYLPTVAKKPLIMMRETAGIQSSFDYSDETDAMKKIAVALKLSPIISAVFANSPIRNGRLTKLKSNRAASWLDTDNDRCGLVSSKAFNKDLFSFDEYCQILLDVPMIFIERYENELQSKKTAIKIENLTFRKFLNNGYKGFRATKEDWLLHLSLYFTDVRFKNYVEIRNQDNQRKDLICSVPAFWKGIIYNDFAICEINEILKNFSYFDFEYLRRKTPQKGLDMRLKHYPLKDIAFEILNVSYQSLKNFGSNEEKFLEPIMNLTKQGLTPADLIIQKWENEWFGNLEKFIKFSRLT